MIQKIKRLICFIFGHENWDTYTRVDMGKDGWFKLEVVRVELPKCELCGEPNKCYVDSTSQGKDQ